MPEAGRSVSSRDGRKREATRGVGFGPPFGLAEKAIFRRLLLNFYARWSVSTRRGGKFSAPDRIEKHRPIPSSEANALAGEHVAQFVIDTQKGP